MNRKDVNGSRCYVRPGQPPSWLRRAVLAVLIFHAIGIFYYSWVMEDAAFGSAIVFIVFWLWLNPDTDSNKYSEDELVNKGGQKFAGGDENKGSSISSNQDLDLTSHQQLNDEFIDGNRNRKRRPLGKHLGIPPPPPVPLMKNSKKHK